MMMRKFDPKQFLLSSTENFYGVNDNDSNNNGKVFILW